MARIYFTVGWLFLALTGFSQNPENDILTATKKEEGVYRTFEEFRTNSPSIRGPFEIKTFRIMLIGEQGKKRNLNEKYWGACKNDSIYVYLADNITGAVIGFPTMEFLGRYCYFSRISTAPAMSMNGMVGGSTTEFLEYVININNGKIYQLTVKLMRIVLKQDEEMLQAFEKEDSKEKSFKKYILEFNAKHPDDIRPVIK